MKEQDLISLIRWTIEEHSNNIISIEDAESYLKDFKLISGLDETQDVRQNEQLQEFCNCKGGATGREVTDDFEYQICDTCGHIAK